MNNYNKKAIDFLENFEAIDKKEQKQEARKAKNRRINYQTQNIIDILSEKMIDKMSKYGLENVLNIRNKSKYIFESIEEYEKNNTLIYEFDYYYYILYNKYESLVNKSKKYIKNIDNFNNSINLLDNLVNNNNIINDNMSEYRQKQKNNNKKGLIFLLLSIFTK